MIFATRWNCVRIPRSACRVCSEPSAKATLPSPTHSVAACWNRPAWLGFLPAIAKRLIGERLKLPSVASWWCGEARAFESVIANLSHLVIKPAFPNQKLGALFGRDLSPEDREALIARIRARPYAFVAQEHLAFSQAPVWYTKNSDGFSARALGIRVYADRDA